MDIIILFGGFTRGFNKIPIGTWVSTVVEPWKISTEILYETLNFEPFDTVVVYKFNDSSTFAKAINICPRKSFLILCDLKIEKEKFLL